MESSRGHLAIDLVSWFRDGLFPVTCFHCGQEGKRLCANCADNFVNTPLETVCPFCHRGSGEGQTCVECGSQTYLDGAVALGLYRDKILRGLLQAWKFSNDRSAAHLIKIWLQRFPLSQMLPPVDWYITAVPLHSARQRERGFNQAEIIARNVEEATPFQYLELLKRSEWTEAQARRDVSERRVGDLDGIFEVISLVPPCVLLCDDVFTSGATMDAAAQALKAAGAQIVWGLTLARADH